MSARPDKSALYRSRLEQGMCGVCGQKHDAKTSYCSLCLEKHRQRQQSTYARRQASVCCHRCGDLLGEAHGKSCIPCTLKAAARKRLNDASRWEELLILYEHQGKRCAISGEKLVFGLNASLDHKLATSKGGTHALQNLQWVTNQVNDAKNARSEAELIEMCRTILKYQKEKQKNNG